MSLEEALCRLVQAWHDAGPRVEAAQQDLCLSTGWPEAHAREAIRRAFAPFTPAAIRRLVRPGRGGQRPEYLLAILAGRVPAVAVNALFWSLAAGVPVRLKSPAIEPTFARHLVRSLWEVAPELQAFASVVSRAEAEALLPLAPVCLAYGSDLTMAQVADKRKGLLTILGGHRESFAVIYQEALTSRSRIGQAARLVAEDVAIYDQSGCLSPHYCLVEAKEARPFAEALLDALAKNPIPFGTYPAAQLAPVRLRVEEARFMGALVLSGPAIPPAVVLLKEDMPALEGPGFRVVQVMPFVGQPDLDALLPRLRHKVQGVAVGGDRGRLSALFDLYPAFRPCRVCGLGRLQRPPALWPENGVVVTRFLARQGCER